MESQWRAKLAKMLETIDGQEMTEADWGAIASVMPVAKRRELLQRVRAIKSGLHARAASPYPE